MIYFPNDVRFKAPVGGVPVGKPVRFRIEAAGNSATLVLTKMDETPVHYPMRPLAGLFEIEVVVTSPGIYTYFFEAEGSRFYADSRLRAVKEGGRQWQLTVYRDDFAPSLSPGIVYQIMPDRFCGGGRRLTTRGNAEYRDDWFGTPRYLPDSSGEIKNNDFFGGNLAGITEKLDYIVSLGVSLIYLGPIFEAASNHKYDTGDYRRIDPDFGSEDDLKRLITEAAKRGVGVMLDGVFSHTGDDSVYFNRRGRYRGVGAWQSPDSPYRSWYRFSRYPDKYECWWGIKTLPCVDENNPWYNEFINGVSGVAEYWTSLGLKGWRLDVADELPDEFLQNFRSAVKSVAPEAVVIGEVWEDATTKVSYGRRRRYLLGGQLDSVTDYPLRSAIIAFIMGGDASALAVAIDGLINNYPPPALNSLFNVLGTHDTERILTVLGGEKYESLEERASARMKNTQLAVKRLQCAVALQYTLPGLPVLFYGDEAGLEGYEDPFCRRCYPWGRENSRLIAFYRLMGQIRRESGDDLAGDYRTLTARGGLFMFERGEGALTVAVNAGSKAVSCKLRGRDLLTGVQLGGILAPLTAVIVKTDCRR